MNLTWHLVKKDLTRLRVPLALFSLLVVGKMVFYAWISGLFSLPDIGWLQRMQSGPEALLRLLMEPIFAYLLVGWLVFEDSPAEPDAHWLTRPLSGGQVFGAKLAGAVLLFVLWPLALNVLGWLAAGVGWIDLVTSAVELVALNLALVALGLATAALTGGFPRFVLWSLVALVVFTIIQLFFTLGSGAGSGPGLSRLVVTAAFGSVAALAITWHQFVTRRHRRSLALMGAGLVAMTVLGFGWRKDFTSAGPRFAPETPASAQMAVTLTGPASYERVGKQHHVRLPVQIGGVPDKAAVGHVSMRGNWSFSGTQAWTSTLTVFRPSLASEAMRRQLGLAAPAEPDGRIGISLPFSLAMAQRVVREPATLKAQAELELGYGEVLAELPLRESRLGAYAVSYVSSGPLQEKRPKDVEPPPVQNGVSLLLTENSAQGLRANSAFRPVATHYALVNRRTGEFFLNDPVRSGPEAITILNQIKVTCLRLTFLLGQRPVKPDELALAVFRFAGGERAKRELVVPAIAFAADSVPATEALPAKPDVTKPDTARMGELVRTMATGDRFMGAVLVAKEGTVLIQQGAGWADLAHKTPNTANTRFRIGSVTKQFTAAAILLLEERGRLGVDEPLAKFMPGIPEAWRAVTLRQLLTHTSGIANFTDLPEYATRKRLPQTPEELVGHLRDRPLDFQPGEMFKYSNTGYVLLGRVVELASGQDYGAFLRESVFLPLGMKDSGYEADAPVNPAHASGYTPGSGGPAKVADIDMHVPGGAGGLYSTLPDLLRWTQGLFGGKLLSSASLGKMIAPDRNGYAFGLSVHTVDGRKVIAHAGAIDGFVSVLTYFPEDKLTVGVLANVEGAPVNDLARQLAEVAFGKTVTLPAERKEIEVPAATLQRYVGVYQLAPGVTNTVRLAGGRLTTQLSGQRAFPLFPESEKKFFLKIVDAQVEFIADDQGRVTHLLQFQAGRTQQAARISDTVAERKAITVPPEILAAYVGRYELRPDFVVTVTLENGHLLAEAPRQPKSVLLAETETRFFSESVDAQAEFVRDSQGAVTHLLVQAGGKSQPARRLAAPVPAANPPAGAPLNQ